MAKNVAVFGIQHHRNVWQNAVGTKIIMRFICVDDNFFMLYNYIDIKCQ